MKNTLSFLLLILLMIPSVALSADKGLSLDSKGTYHFTEWLLNSVEAGPFKGTPIIYTLTLTESKNKTAGQILISYEGLNQENLFMTFVIDSTADKNEPVLLISPKYKVIEALSITSCDEVACNAKLDQLENIKNIVAQFQSFEKSSSKEPCFLTFTDKKTREPVIVPVSLEGFNEAFQSLKNAKGSN